MTAESPWDDDRRFYGEDDFGDTYFEDEHYDPNDPGESSVDEVPRCTQCDRPVDPDQDLCEECEHDKELESENPYGPIHDDVSMTYEKRIDDLAFASSPRDLVSRRSSRLPSRSTLERTPPRRPPATTV